jgi:hypothetical protein
LSKVSRFVKSELLFVNQACFFIKTFFILKKDSFSNRKLGKHFLNYFVGCCLFSSGRRTFYRAKNIFLKKKVPYRETFLKHFTGQQPVFPVKATV